jgi:thymidylate synthase
MRSCDVPLGLPFNIASYGLLLTLLGKLTNMIPDELIGNLGDTHIYKNQIDGVKEQIGSNLSLEERINYWFNNKKPNRDVVDWFDTLSESEKLKYLYECGIPFKSRSPYPLPKLNINTELWPTESGECGIGNIDANLWLEGLNDWNFVKCLIEEDIQLVDYQYYPTIKFPLSN